MFLWVIGVACCVIYFVGGWYGQRLRARMLDKLTAVNDLETLGKIRKGKKLSGRAVVCGGSIAGLLTARACADQFDSVFVIDSEGWISTADGTVDNSRSMIVDSKRINPRSRVMQYTHLHLYQTFTTLALKRWFPDWADRVMKAKGVLGPVNFETHINGKRMVIPWQDYPDLQVMSLSRSAYETTLRKALIETCPNVSWMLGTVTGVTPSQEDKSRIVSVTVRTKDNDINEIDASFVADCTGPTQAGLKWLQRHGYATLPSDVTQTQFQESYDPKMRYVTLEAKIDPVALQKIIPSELVNETQIALYMNLPTPAVDNHHIIISKAEGDYVNFALGGWGVENLPSTVSEVRPFLESYAAYPSFPPWLSDLIDLVERTSESHPTHVVFVPMVKFSLSILKYQKLGNLPRNFVAVGDSTMRLNPVRGQGCSKAAVGAVTLNALLSDVQGSEVPQGFGKTFFKKMAARTHGVWNQLKNDDYGRGSTIFHEGDNEKTGKFGRWLGKHLIPLALKDKEVGRMLFETGQFIAPPTDLFAPRILGKVALQVFRSYF